MLLKNLDKYKTVNSIVSNIAVKKLLGHLWYLGEELVALAFFDKKVTTETKREMVRALKQSGAINVPKRATIEKQLIQEKCLENFVSKNTLRFFRVMEIDCKFLDVDPYDWFSDPDNVAAEAVVKTLKVVNDVAERGVALIDSYNRLQTKQKQYLLRVVSDHRKRYPDFRKATLAAV